MGHPRQLSKGLAVTVLFRPPQMAVQVFKISSKRAGSTDQFLSSLLLGEQVNLVLHSVKVGKALCVFCIKYQYGFLI